jgi:hypothetical protein
VMNIVVASCWLSRGDVESSVLLLLHARTHLKKKKKKIAPVTRMVVVTRKVRYIWYQSEVRPATWDSLRVPLT